MMEETKEQVVAPRKKNNFIRVDESYKREAENDFKDIDIIPGEK